MRKSHCFFTSFNKAYAAQALLLAESIRRYHGPDHKIYALLVDELTEEESHYLRAFDKVICASELNIPNFKNWIFGLSIVEAATAVKPFALCHLLDNYSQVTYLDPDTLVYSRLDEILDSPAKWDVALTPHQTTPQTERWLVEATELESLRFGVYNLGFLTVKSSTNGKLVAKWWKERCYDYCVSEPERGLFTDQKLFDLAPAIFSGIHVLRHRGYNVATWNLRERNLSFSNQKLTVDQFPLRFCHFTKASHIGAAALARMVSGDNFFIELFFSYVSQLLEKKERINGLSQSWSYGVFNDGSEISTELKIQFRRLRNRLEYVDPFDDKTIIEKLLAQNN